MKLFTRFIGLFIALLIVCTAVLACGVTTVPPSAEPIFSITEEFVITRPIRGTDAELTSARTIRDALSAIGLTVRVQEDWYADVDDIPKCEILVGDTNREESKTVTEKLADNEYAIRVSGGEESGYKIVIAGNGDRAIQEITEYFIATYLTAAEQNSFSVSLQHYGKFEFPCKDVMIADASVGDYVIVYAKEGVTSPVDPNYKTFIQTAKYKDAAEALAAAIEDVAGVRPTVMPDTASLPDGTPKILFGKTDCPEDDSQYANSFADAGAYTATLTADGTVILAGDNACAAYAAGEALVDALCAAKTNLTDLNVSATKDLIKVACIGDSITHGTTSDDESAYNYPVYLQQMLGYDYYVEKYGAPGFSMTSTDTFSYMSYSAMYKGSQEAKPDVVIIMLGTNDCNPFDDYKDWSDPNRATTFKKSAGTMIDAYRRANRDVQVYLMTPPTVPGNADWANNVKTHAVPLITEVAEAKECYLIDIYSWSRKNTSVFTDNGGDGLHPKNENYEKLAQAVYNGLKDTIRKP
ncbi:MAG: GDSL-type esterase/lipase family protein [Eubacteriales bacterium]